MFRFFKLAIFSFGCEDEIDFKIKTITRNKEGHYILIKGSNQKDDIAIANTYESNIGALQYIRCILITIKGEIDSDTIIVGDINTPVSPTD